MNAIRGGEAIHTLPFKLTLKSACPLVISEASHTLEQTHHAAIMKLLIREILLYGCANAVNKRYIQALAVIVVWRKLRQHVWLSSLAAGMSLHAVTSCSRLMLTSWALEVQTCEHARGVGVRNANFRGRGPCQATIRKANFRGRGPCQVACLRKHVITVA